MASVEQLHATPGVCAAPDASTKDFILQQVGPQCSSCQTPKTQPKPPFYHYIRPWLNE
jgi:hypothetical protein